MLRSDLFADLPDDLRGRVDVLTANVPYVPSASVALMPREAREHEPRLALDGGADGLDVLRRVAAEAPTWLAPGGTLLVVGHHPHDVATGLRGHAVDFMFTAEDLLPALDGDSWDVEVVEARPREAAGPDGVPVMLHDAVLRARRR